MERAVVEVIDSATGAQVGSAAPAGTERALYVRVVGGGGGGGGGVVQQGARDATVQAWFVDFNGVAQPITDGGGSITVDSAQLPAALVGGRLDVNLGSQGAFDLSVSVPAGVNVTDRDARLLGRAKILDSAGTVIDPALKGQLPAALVGGRLDANIGAWLGSTAPTVGAKVSANSVPVVIASDQAALDVSKAALDVSDRAARDVGRVRLWDGTDIATMLPARTQPAPTSEVLVPTAPLPARIALYGCATTSIAPAITVGVKELLALWQTTGVGNKDIYIVKIIATGIVTTASTAGRSALRVSTITSAPTGGTELGKADLTGAGAAAITNTMQVKTGGGAIGTTFVRNQVWQPTQAVGSRVEALLFEANNLNSAILLRTGSSSGISIDIEREVAHTALVDQWEVAVQWVEL